LLVKRRKKISDVESDSSASADSDDDFVAGDEDDDRRSVDDTDEDPVWRPKKPKTSFGSVGSAKVIHITYLVCAMLHSYTIPQGFTSE